MNTDSLTLHVGADYISAFALSAFVALTEKKLHFATATVDLRKRENYLPVYRDLSLTNKVPTLQQGSFSLSESSAIAEYVDDFFPAPDYPALYPASLERRSRARQLQAWLRSDLLVIRKERPADLIYFEQSVTPLTEEARCAAERLYRVADVLLSDDSGYLFGAWSIADIDLACMLQRLVAGRDNVPAHLVDYVKHQWGRPSVQAWMDLPRTR